MDPSPAECIFLTDLYDSRWSSVLFYANMQARIREVLARHGRGTRMIIDPGGAALPASSVVVVDPAAIQALHRRDRLPWLLDNRFVLIIGENPDRRRRTFTGWVGPLGKLTFSPGNLLYRVIQTAWKATWQSEPMRDLLLSIKKSEDVSFFPIDGFRPEDVLDDAGTAKDIDILVYGAMSYKRRAAFVVQILKYLPEARLVICSNVFGLDDLLRRSKIVVHVNSVKDCYHVPYAKIMRPLANHKILFVEDTPEMQRSDLRPFLETFTMRRFRDFVPNVRATLDAYPAMQARLEAMNPRSLLQRRYDFETHVRQLFLL